MTLFGEEDCHEDCGVQFDQKGRFKPEQIIDMLREAEIELASVKTFLERAVVELFAVTELVKSVHGFYRSSIVRDPVTCNDN